ncbi:MULTISPECIES: hypothetical protein [Novacetimonas]|uniref:Uncharacterized protein n=2 Tax=Novacetimonas hansenii TaxID=436 RepID=A0ABQ0SCZ6_NOVHA|nr:hypothetical protein [Novacetimonas hansenii]EFG85354.1 hypothetical protein GXY_03493 [Novacetimonas hansenii ATCC 23769]GAN84715.1 hypothetical protein Gaha_0202_005 [Novacetimonas hansenii JCM 7643]GBQ52376.1 hypothetical protein AA0243_0007 [Novacetimonas hansenii NRIC 0243]GEC63116.1 hypothetical protein GHA01_09650 [Novacetimonas hansenii]
MAEEIHEIVLTENTILLPGDKVRVGPDVSSPFKSKINEEGKCVDAVNSSRGLSVQIQFNDGAIIKGSRSGLILTEFYTGAAPGGKY